MIGSRPPAAREAIAALIFALAILPTAGVTSAGTGASPADPKPARRIDAPAAPPPEAAGRLDPGETPVLRDGNDLVLEVRSRPGSTYVDLAQRYLVDLREVASVRRLNGDSPPASGIVALPYASLNDTYKLRTIRTLFPEDHPRDGNWVHRFGVGRIPATEESLWLIALWLTGRGESFGALADRNDLPGLSPRRGQEIVVPGSILLPAFARAAGASLSAVARPTPPPAAADEGGDTDDDFTEAPEDESQEPPAPPPGAPSAPARVPVAEGAEDLRYGADTTGRYAIYRLKRGEALYSAVVVRFTGRVDAQDVNDLARQIARRSTIRDVTDIPIGYRVKIPLDLLLPEYLPRDDPRRQAWERSQADVARYTNRARSRNLQGVAVILDAGHGGRDRGAAHNGIWEHDYVYDILCRIKAILEEKTGARVLPTIKDRKEGYAIHNSTRLPRSQAEVLLTTPPFALEQRIPSVNLRWYLSNSYYRHLVAQGQDPSKVVFTSLHADARHPSVGGAMIYVPGEEYRRGRYGHSSAVYTRHREVREQPYVSFTHAERDRSEGLSREFAAKLITAFKRRGVAVHPYGPVRERIIRHGRSWVPAVLRCNIVPVQVLLEVSNLNNRTDSHHLADPAYRQKVAAAYVDALQLYFGDGGKGASPAVSSAARSR